MKNNIPKLKESKDMKAEDKIERGKNLITDIAMTCSNNFLVIDSLMEILELLADVNNPAEDLQNYLFTWTREHDDSLTHWKKSVLSGRKYQNTPDSKTEDAPSLESLAIQLSEVMRNPLLPTKLYNVLSDELAETYVNTDTPESILMNLKSQLKVEEAKNE